MPSADAEIAALHKEWDDARCPICMDHPHNAVLLLCSSQDKGCRSYMCDTSYGHSECLYGFRKMKANRMDSSSQPSSSLPGDTSNQGVSQRSRLSHSTGSPRLLVDVPEFRENLSHEHVIRSSAAVSGQQGTNYNQGPVTLEAHMGQVSGQVESAEVSNSNQLMCPLCRGDTVPGREARSCSREACAFSGTYGALRKHVRRAHPTTRPHLRVSKGVCQTWFGGMRNLIIFVQMFVILGLMISCARLVYIGINVISFLLLSHFVILFI
ncbi:hypothetical protein ZWY2020_040427 [Hordeum vulgare]|nr:hypothetical protein ZWY2020_040427 [Hordeum vulgare]